MKSIVFLLFFSSSALYSTGLRLGEPLLYIENDQAYTVFHIQWDNAWYNGNNHDGAWVFFKSLQGEAGSRHIRVAASGHMVVSDFSDALAGLEFEVADDRTGVFIRPAQRMRGGVEATVRISLDMDSFDGFDYRIAQFKAFGIEVVHVPPGGFTLGDPDTAALSIASMYRPAADGSYGGLVRIDDEDQVIEVGPAGDLYYRARSDYEGDQTGTIPASFPKGVDGFYIMKYEPTEALYAAFLNSLTPAQAAVRELHEELGYYDLGGHLRSEDGRYVTDHPDSPCRFMGWDDSMALADWTAQRPMTEFEFTKAARGTSDPVVREYPWNTGQKAQVVRLPDPDWNIVMANGWDEGKLNDGTKTYFGASQYWVMDLAGSMWERVISIGHPKGRSYVGDHGDGNLSEEGFADVADWPSDIGGTEGWGFRGGGFYGYGRDYHHFNPFSPIAYRPYAGWAGAIRSNAYGTRFVRGR